MTRSRALVSGLVAVVVVLVLTSTYTVILYGRQDRVETIVRNLQTRVTVVVRCETLGGCRRQAAAIRRRHPRAVVRRRHVTRVRHPYRPSAVRYRQPVRRYVRPARTAHYVPAPAPRVTAPATHPPLSHPVFTHPPLVHPVFTHPPFRNRGG